MLFRSNSTWFTIASKSLGVPEAVLRDYATHGDGLSLGILIHVTRMQCSHFRKESWPVLEFSKALLAASNFNVEDTLPELQYGFCALWNQIIGKVQNDNDRMMTYYILGQIRNVYLALHQGTDSAPATFSASTRDGDPILWDPSSYRTCNIPSHYPDSTPHIYDDSVSPIFAPSVLQNNAAPLSAPHSGTPNAPSSPVPASLYSGEILMDVPLLNNTMSVSTSLYPARQATMGNLRSPGTSPDPAVAGTTQDIEIFPRTTHLLNPELSVYTPPPSSMTSTSPPDAATLEHTAGRNAPLDDLDVSWSPSPTPVMLSTGPLLSPDSSAIGSDHPASYPESRSSMLAPGAPGPSRPRGFSAPDMDAASRGKGNAVAKAALREEKGTPYRSSTIHREEIIANPDLPPQSPSSPPINNAENTGGHPPRCSRGYRQYDIV